MEYREAIALAAVTIKQQGVWDYDFRPDGRTVLTAKVTGDVNVEAFQTILRDGTIEVCHDPVVLDMMGGPSSVIRGSIYAKLTVRGGVADDLHRALLDLPVTVVLNEPEQFETATARARQAEFERKARYEDDALF